MGSQLLEKICAATLNGKKQHVYEIQKRQCREDARIGARTADILRAKRWVRGGESRREDEEGFVGVANISSQEVWEDCARYVDGRRMRVVAGIPLIL